MIKCIARLVAGILFLPALTFSQKIEKVSYDAKDTTAGYYLAIRPQSGEVKATLVLLSSFTTPEYLLPETKLHSVAYVNDILTVVAFMNNRFYPDSAAIARLNLILTDVAARYSVSGSKITIGGHDESGMIALRFAELAQEHPAQFPIQPRAVFGIGSPVDLFGLWHWSERQIKKDFYPGTVGDARYYLDVMTKAQGTIYDHAEKYKALTPFNSAEAGTGNEKFLKNVAVRLYYDTDMDWQLKNRRNSFYDTYMPDASELINRLLLSGHTEAEFISSRLPGLRSNGVRHPQSLSIVDEVECIQWIKRTLHIFDANTWVPPYHLTFPKGWPLEHFVLPPDFAPGFTYQGVEDLRFAPGWGKRKTDDYWSYAYLWWLEGIPKVDAATLQDNLKAYYNGLVGRNIISRKIPEKKVVPLSVALKKIKTAASDLETFGGEIRMLDYMAQEPMVLNAIVHKRKCEQRMVIFVEVSPKPLTHQIWQSLDALWNDFRCTD